MPMASPRRHSRAATRAALAAVLSLAAAVAGGADQRVWRETVETPHWPWVERHETGTVRALFLPSDKAMREPGELAQRFDIEAVTVPVTGDNYSNSFDENLLLAELKKGCDVIVLASPRPWQHLSEKAREAIAASVRKGTAAAVFGKAGGRGEPAAELSNWLLDGGGKDITKEIRAGLPLSEVSFRGNRFRARRYRTGKGQVILAENYDVHYTFFTAFVPRPESYFGNRIAPEIAYALAARIIRAAAGKQGSLRVKECSAPETVRLGEAAPISLRFEGRARDDDVLRWRLYTIHGEEVGRGEARPPARAELTATRGGRMAFIYRVEREGRTLDWGACVLDVVPPVSIASADTPAVIAPEAACRVEWKLQGDPDDGDRLQIQIYDPEERLVVLVTVPAAAGEARVPGWIPSAVSHQVRLLLMRGDLVLHEQRLWVQVSADRRRDLSAFHTILWSTEGGASVERWRYPLLRDLGITAMADIGRKTKQPRMASEEGMRIVPTNVFVPGEMKRERGKSPEEARAAVAERLETFVKDISVYSPLGYSLVDEPSGTDVFEWHEAGARAIRRHDRNAPVGYCGFWPNTGSDLARLLRMINFAEGYSPTHLYTPDLWSGTERDLYRSLRRGDGIVTCWTHYAPWRDHEPYSRTVPWLWLFEEFNGVSYFDSAGNFAVLPSDMRTTHETRWWSEEVRLLQRGLGEQIIAAGRDHGSVRVVYHPGAAGLGTWLKALNGLNVSYRVIDRSDLDKGLDARALLVILPDVRTLSDAALDALGEAAGRGCHIISVGATAAFAAAVPEGDASFAPRDRLRTLFGVVREAPDTKEVWSASRDLHSGVPCRIQWQGSVLSGATSGETNLSVLGAEIPFEFEALGEAQRDDAEGGPEFIRQIFATPAAVRKDHGKGAAWYLTFQPDVAALGKWLPSVMKRAGVPAPRERVTVDDKRPPTVYLYPFIDGPIRLVGVIQDYWRVDPASELKGERRKETAAYYHHGPQIWAARKAVLYTAGHHAYNCREGRYVGADRSIEFTLQPGRPEAFALLPYKVRGIDVHVPASVKQGTVLEAKLELVAEDAAPGDHVLHVRMTDPEGRARQADRRNVRTNRGAGSVLLPIPFNAGPGAWRLTVRDALTGVHAERTVTVEQGDEIPVEPLAEERCIVRRTALDRPAGVWQAYEEKTIEGVEVSVSALRRKWQRVSGGAKYRWHLNGGFSLTNVLRSYQLTYRVCDDWEAYKWEKGRISAPYPPGLGFKKPRVHMWYYNGYIVVKIDGQNASVFALTRIEQVEAGDNGRVEVTWKTPYGWIDLASVMMPDHTGLFQELTVRAREPVGRIDVAFRSYPQGFGRPGKELLLKVDPRKRWALTGNTLYDRAYGKGMGPGAILVLPEELDKIKFGTSPSLAKVVDPAIKSRAGGGTPDIDAEEEEEEEEDDTLDLEDEDAEPDGDAEAPGQPPVKLHWVLWMFPELSNEKAEDYMRRNADDTRARLIKIFHADGPGR